MRIWNKIHKGSNVTLEHDTQFNGFDGVFILKAGIYKITGFYANACGLSNNGQIYYIPSIGLKQFKDII